ncbi:MAG: GC-type dockerin domain-anchored protein [Phycisphaerales bacterium JB060]
MRSMLSVVLACGVAAPVLAQTTLIDDGFEDYTVGSAVAGQGGWDLWPGGADAFVSDAEAASGSNSFLADQFEVDVIYRMRDGSGTPIATSGQWTFSCQTFMSSSAVGDFYVLLLNQFNDADPTMSNWSMQVRLGTIDQLVESQFDGATLPLILDEWVELRAEIDLDADSFDIYYNDEILAEDLVWTENVSGGGLTQIDVLDLYAPNANPTYIDDVLLVEADGGGCRADLDGDGELTIFDFLTFQNLFDAGDLTADFDGDGALTIFDFLSFQNEFDAGCP